MSEQKVKPLAIAVGAALAGSLAAASVANADNPFQMAGLSAGYQLAAAGEGSCGEGKCGGDKGDESGEGDKGGEGSCGGDKG